MTAHKDLKRIIRARQRKTGESYTAARVHVMRDRTAMLGLENDEGSAVHSVRAEVVVLKVNRQSARVRVLGEDEHTTFRSNDVGEDHLMARSVDCGGLDSVTSSRTSVEA